MIFEVDGTHVASNEAHARSWVEAFSEAGFEVPFDVVWPMIGMGGDKLMPAAVGIESETPSPTRISCGRPCARPASSRRS
ncbi:MAG: hypothetical protein ABIZ73_04290 [Gemmatimonadaceae bacterium]